MRLGLFVLFLLAVAVGIVWGVGRLRSLSKRAAGFNEQARLHAFMRGERPPPGTASGSASPPGRSVIAPSRTRPSAKPAATEEERFREFLERREKK